MPNTSQITQIPSSRVEINDATTGLISRDWYRFFFNLFTVAGGGALPGYTNPPAIVSVGGSPFSYANSAAYDVDILISGGGVEKLEYSRDGLIYYDTGSYYGMFTLSPGDRIRMTYLTAPSLTLIPR